MSARIGRGVLISTFVVLALWFYTPLPTLAARYAWDEWHAGTLALSLNRSDALLASAIGAYYFGNQFATSTTAARPYNLFLARKAFGKSIDIDPSMPFTHYLRARVAFVQSDFGAALEDLTTELTLAPENKRTLYMRGLVYAYRGETNDLFLAEQDFKAFVAWAPKEWAGYNDLAFVLAKEKQYGNAATVLKEGIAKADGGETNPWLWNALGIMELNLENPLAALTALTKAQTFAASLAEVDWQRAYPGNDPSGAADGIEAMRTGIAKNLVAAYTSVKK
jgi:hypothetical protein